MTARLNLLSQSGGVDAPAGSDAGRLLGIGFDGFPSLLLSPRCDGGRWGRRHRPPFFVRRAAASRRRHQARKGGFALSSIRVPI
jgi:hypothetical protein